MQREVGEYAHKLRAEGKKEWTADTLKHYWKMNSQPPTGHAYERLLKTEKDDIKAHKVWKKKVKIAVKRWELKFVSNSSPNWRCSSSTGCA